MLSPEQAESLELLLEVGRLLSSKLELSELLRTIMELAARVVNAETASLLLVDEKTNELYFDVALGLPPDVAKIRLKMGQGICGAVAAKNKPLIINDVRKDPRWTQKVDKESGFVTRSILAAPVALKGRCIGVVEAINHKDGEFSFKDLRVFEAFASQAAVAIENARLFASLQEEKFKLSTVFEEMKDAALLTDEQGRVLLANPAARLLLGEDAGSLADAVRGYALSPSIEEITRGEGLVRFEAVREQPKKLVLAGASSVVRDLAGGQASGKVRGRVVLFRDVTEEKHEEGLKRSFLSLISHKLKTPLASVTGYSQLLITDLSSKPGTEFTVKALRTIEAQGQKLTGLVEKLLNYTILERIDDTEFSRKPFEVDNAVKEAVDGLGAFLSERKAVAEVRPSGLRALGDQTLVRDALKNLIENGAKFAAGPDNKVAVWAERRGADVEIHVRDSGPGIPPEEHARVFARFHQVEASFTGQTEGWGLGLSFVKKVIEKLGGSVRLQSAPGAGSTFTVSLPAAD
ncbi:MAG: ATP-binding protein [Elusimicrobiota bacterium]